MFNEFLGKYPLDSRSAQILYVQGQMLFDEKKWDEAIDAWRKAVAKYPNTNEASLSQFMIGVVYEQKLDKLDKALEEFRKTTYGASATTARQAVARLTSKRLSIGTERTFRSGETPKVTLQSRNIDSVTVRCYRIDLETYFRKMYLIQGIEGLDIALIDPDKTFEYKIPEYAEYRHFDNKIDVPLPPIMGREKRLPPSARWRSPCRARPLKRRRWSWSATST
ncbi:MAG: tetratricopeptide repeat protein [Pirellulales bacterium]